MKDERVIVEVVVDVLLKRMGLRGMYKEYGRFPGEE